ncbi:uncharacterized protein LOC132699423 isoform X2 [Cylas formicarius]|uniref:uncharacterized protein LOC132699423 isoform X2 n=1 Tax=Cylas formicarius TaxID=197179 RepID=UPI002958A160|nr:uncharacterized protein LOC132699423 isoform X2 [Cylas formicarius]
MVQRRRAVKLILSNASFQRQRCTSDSTKMNGDTFEGKLDRFEGITVWSDQESCDIGEFPKKLKNSLTLWRDTKKRGIWFRVHLEQADWVPVLAKNGFKYHHARDDYVTMYLWLPTTETSNIPHYAHTMIGVGAVVVNDKDQVLVVQEKFFYKRPMWKLPGGYVEPGENLVDAAIREVMEETNIRTEFDSLLTLRHVHQGMFGCSDIYIVVSLKPISFDIDKCNREIEKCQWMDIKEYLKHPHVHELNRFFAHKYLKHREHSIKIDVHHGIHQLVKIPYTVYSVEKLDQSDTLEFEWSDTQSK